MSVKDIKDTPRYKIHIDSMLRLSAMGIDLEGDVWLDLPNIEGLDEAVILINKAASMELERRQKDCLDMFLVNQFGKLKKAGGSLTTVHEIMKETAEYYKGRKSPLQAKEEPEQAKKEPVDAVINFTALEIVRSMTNYNLTEHQKEALQNNARIVIKNHLY